MAARHSFFRDRDSERAKAIGGEARGQVNGEVSVWPGDTHLLGISIVNGPRAVVGMSVEKSMERSVCGPGTHICWESA